MLKRLLVAAPVLAALTFSAPALAGGTTDSIWINAPAGAAATSMKYGDMFTAGYSSKASQPWGFAQCWANGSTVLGTPNQGTYAPGDVIWSEYRSLWAGSAASGPFQLTDPIQNLWLGGGATCTLSLVKFSGRAQTQTVLAKVGFTVAP